MHPIHLIPLSNRVLRSELLQLEPELPILACDFYVEGAEAGEAVVGGYRLGRVWNVDHHAPTGRMRRLISSTNLALERLAAGVSEERALVVINHVDCDSVLSAALLAGRLPPHPRFGASAIAADHTGEEDDIAELLQAMDVAQSRAWREEGRPRGFESSFRNLLLLLEGEPLEPFAAAALADRQARRRAAEQVVREGRFQAAGGVWWAVTEEAIDGEFFPALLPEARLLMMASPHPLHPGRWQMKLRRGLAAAEGFALSELSIEAFDPAYGGRWNAGSNRRGGGTEMAPGEYARRLAERLRERLGG